MTEFKRARMIELHEANVVLCEVDKYSDIWNPEDWRISRLYSSDASRLVNLLHLALSQEYSGKIEAVESIDITHKRKVIGEGPLNDAGIDDAISRLYVRFQSPGLLDLKIVFRGNRRSDGREYTENLTYSGHFTIWWPDDETEETAPANDRGGR